MAREQGLRLGLRSLLRLVPGPLGVLVLWLRLRLLVRLGRHPLACGP